MRVLLVSGEYPPYMFGGGATFMYHLSRGLTNRGLDVTVVSMRFSKKFEKKVDVEEHGSRLRVFRVSVPAYLYPRHEVFQVVARPLIAKLIKEHDVVHINTGLYFPFLRDVIKESKKPTIVTIHGDPILVYKVSLKLSNSFIEVIYGLLHMSEAHTALKKELTELYPVFVSKSLYETMKTKYKINHHGIVYNGVDYEYIDKALVSEPKTTFYSVIIEAKKRGYRILVYPARLHPIKNHLTLIKILYLLLRKYNFKALLVLIGDGIARTSILKLASKLGVSKHILMTGKLPYDETLRILGQAHAIPYVSLYEAHPISVVEALYLGKPIIAFNYPYIKEVIDVCSSQGLSCDIKLVDSINEFINEIIYESLDDRMIARRAFLDQFSLDHMVNMYLNIYEEELL